MVFDALLAGFCEIIICLFPLICPLTSIGLAGACAKYPMSFTMRKKRSRNTRTTIIKNTTLATIPFESKKLELVVWISAGFENESIVSETDAVALDKASPVSDIALFIEGSGDDSFILNIYTWIYILLYFLTKRLEHRK